MPQCHGDDVYRRIAQRIRERDGVLFWIDGKNAGRPVAVLPNGSGHLRFNFQGSHVLAHRVVWFMHVGRLPHGVIDHINDDPTDNRIENLRDIDHRRNNRANKLREFGHIKRTGAAYVARNKYAWNARILLRSPSDFVGKSKPYHLGSFRTEAEARAACIAAEKLADALTVPSSDSLHFTAPRASRHPAHKGRATVTCPCRDPSASLQDARE